MWMCFFIFKIFDHRTINSTQKSFTTRATVTHPTRTRRSNVCPDIPFFNANIITRKWMIEKKIARRGKFKIQLCAEIRVWFDWFVQPFRVPIRFVGCVVQTSSMGVREWTVFLQHAAQLLCVRGGLLQLDKKRKIWKNPGAMNISFIDTNRRKDFFLFFLLARI